MAKLVSKTYGEALFELAAEEHTLDSLREEIEALKIILQENPDFDRLMKHPGIPKQDKLQVLENVLKGRISQELLGFLELIITKERYKQLPDIFQYFIDKVKEYQGIGVAYVTTAVALGKAQEKAVEERLLQITSCRRMEMHYMEDASLIGGMVIRIGDRVVDSSIRTSLERLTKQLLQIQLG